MKRDLDRLFRPRTIAVIGGGAWCAAIIGAARRIGYSGEIFPVHPSGKNIAGLKAYKRLEDWPGAIDAAFIGINRHATIEAVDALQALGAGGAVCFASGFTEAQAEDDNGADLQAQLVAAAGDMPVLGPNCYGFVNAVDGAAIWPDQHGMVPVERGVAILTQSSNIAINMTMQTRGLPIAYMVTCGNMAQTSQAEIATSLLGDDRVTAIGVHIEGFGDLHHWEALAQAAWNKGVPIVALKVGKSAQAQQATVSHTASLAGSDAGAQAFMRRLGIPAVQDLAEFLETLKLLHSVGPLQSNRIASISCSGGEASLIADLAVARDLEMPTLPEARKQALRVALGPMVALANPLDYHTYIWRDTDAMATAWGAMTGDDIGLTLSIVDYPHTDPTDWTCATQAALRVRAETGRNFAMVASLPELMPLDVAEQLMAGGVVPLHGLDTALAAAEAAARVQAPALVPVAVPGTRAADRVLSEAEAKAALAAHGVAVPKSAVARRASEAAAITATLQPPLVVKGLGHAHKTEAGAVRLGLAADEVASAVDEIGGNHFLVEEMVSGTVVELLIGVLRDPAHGFVLTLGAGGVMTELLRDTVSLLLPVSGDDIEAALAHLRCAPVLAGYRGKPGVDMRGVVEAVLGVQDYVLEHSDRVSEVEINPLVCTADRAVAVDALIRTG
ncbi:acetate--CoA ligase family protein [Phaeobacter marinintestinus]|uniref:acetate--CoA ligase family protein n=1 Tax=Falsiphaeobacter marinintestinus TaxID=1492905 RepID=UPI0011B3B3AD|nr:acetate--CoA ligase family protein [Phaeobacter marinintestinus]